MFVIQPDVHLTRRKRIHQILDERSQQQWAGQSFIEALNWLLDTGHNQTMVSDGRTSFILTFVLDR